MDGALHPSQLRKRQTL